MPKINATLTAVVIFDQKLYVKGHLINRWMTLLCQHFETHAQVEAPEHTGLMKSLIKSEAHQVAPRAVEGTIESGAPYSLFVLRGTTGPIMSNRMWNTWKATGFSTPPTFLAFNLKKQKNGAPLRIPKRGMFLKFEGYDGLNHVAVQVRGQDANNFLFRAWKKTARTHPAIRGIGIPSAISNP